jgi:hypothetical protein
MHSMIRAGELPPTPGGTVTFEGEPYGSGVSRRGHARMTADDKDFEAGPGDIVVVGSETPTSSRTPAPSRSTSSASTPRPG